MHSHFSISLHFSTYKKLKISFFSQIYQYAIETEISNNPYIYILHLIISFQLYKWNVFDLYLLLKLEIRYSSGIC